jgi:type VII secretion protein EccE
VSGPGSALPPTSPWDRSPASAQLKQPAPRGRSGLQNTQAVPVRVPQGAAFAAFDPARGDAVDVAFGEPAPAGTFAPTPVPASLTQAAPRRSLGLLDRFQLVQLVLVEVAAAAAVLGWAGSGIVRVLAVLLAAVVFLLAVVPIGGRWLYMVGLSWLGLLQRKRSISRGRGLSALLGEYGFETVEGRGDTEIGVLRHGDTWTLALEISTDSLVNDDAAVPLADLESMLIIEDVVLADVRLLTTIVPARTRVGGQSADTSIQAAVVARAVARHCLLTVDTHLAAAALAARGGSQAATAQILRRCALRADEVLSQSGATVRTLDQAALSRWVGSCLGPASVDAAGPNRGEETWRGVVVGGTRSSTVALSGAASSVGHGLMELAAFLPGAVAVSALVVRRGARGKTVVSAYLRASEPTDSAGDVGQLLRALSRAGGSAGLSTVQVGGDQVEVFGLTTPLGGRR